MRDKNGSSSFGSGGAKDPRLEAIMKEAMQRSAADFEQIDEQYEREKEKERTDAANALALVPITEADLLRQRKQNRELLKMKAKMASAGGKNERDDSKSGRVFYDADANHVEDEGTFVTGLGIPGKSKKTKNRVAYEESKYFAYPEDELMDRVERAETEMKDMMRYLVDVENMMGGTDLEEIQRMLDCTR